MILKRIYDKHEITTNIGRKEMKELINLWAINIPFTFKNEILETNNKTAWQWDLL